MYKSKPDVAEKPDESENEWITVRHGKSHSKSKTQVSILEKVKNGTLNPSDAVDMYSKKTSYYSGKPYFHVTRGGSLALYGIRKNAIVLYANKWKELRDFLNSDKLDVFLKEHDNEFRKPNKDWANNIYDKHKDKPFLKGNYM